MLRAFKSIRGLVGIGLAVGLVAAACGGSSSTGNLPGLGNAGGTNAAGGGGNSLTSGLSSNLDNLDSYQFSWSLSGSSGGAAASPGDSGSFGVTGTVINKPTKAVFVNDMGAAQFIDIGDQEWTSLDGNTWTGPTTADSSLTDMLPTHDYASWFDAQSTNFTVAGTETKNGVSCVHYKGNSSLGALYGALAGVSANFQADLWVAKDGNYPVSGAYGFAAATASSAGAFYFTFDITHINDASNKVTAPTNVVAIPT
ncbi:MAG: hypothetical protein ABSE58_12160 [Candidatus Limnocylindrales bacterium]|jgi:hypothetical protein